MSDTVADRLLRDYPFGRNTIHNQRLCMSMDSALRVFARIVERGSMTSAARDLGVSQPALSKSIRALEAHVGTCLLTRTSRALKPTAHGLALYQAIGGAIASIDAAIEAVRCEIGGISGALRLHAPVCVGERHLTRIVLDFQAAHPGVTVHLALEDRAVDLVAADIDLAFRVGKPEGDSLVVRRIGASRRLLVASPAYLARRGSPSGPADLARHDLILAETFLSPRGTFTLCRGAAIREVAAQPVLTTNNPQVLLQGLAAGRGVGPAQRLLVSDELADGRLIRVLPRWEVRATDLYLAYQSARLMRPVVRAFIDVAVPALRKVEGVT